MAKIVVLIGVSGSGKSFVGERLARAMNCDFVEGDDLHSEDNIHKMEHNIPLTDEDRFPWLKRVAEKIGEHVERNKDVVVACSALKKSYRDILRVEGHVRMFLLDAPREVLEDRLEHRKHFFPAKLLNSQLETLERPLPDEHIVILDARVDADTLVPQIMERLAASGQ